MMEAGIGPEMLEIYSAVMHLIAQEDFIVFSHCENFKLCTVQNLSSSPVVKTRHTFEWLTSLLHLHCVSCVILGPEAGCSDRFLMGFLNSCRQMLE
jgi:hypothetical protein